MACLKVLDPGPMTTVQDLGRYGYQGLGVPISGALDQISARIANWLVGNQAGDALLEATAVGPKLEALEEVWISVTGAEAVITINGEEAEGWKSLRMRPGDVLWIKKAVRGLRIYVAVSGGVDVPKVMGSRSTYVPGRMGGLDGRPLAKGDLIKRLGDVRISKPLSLPEELRPGWEREIVLRAVPGPQDDHFGEGMEIFFASTFTVTPQSDRMGCRLEGPPVPRKPEAPQSIISEPSMPGSVQIPPDGKPIVLLVEQTVGGYSKIATTIWPDICLVAQARPGDRIRFRRLELEEAHKIYRETWNRLESIRQGLGAPL